MLLRAATSQVNSCSWYQLIRRRMSSNHDNNSSKNSTGQGGDSALFRMKSKYVKLLEDAPMLTKSITSSLLSGGADFICQLGSNSNSVTTIERAPLPWSVITNRLTDYDLQRTITFTILGGALVGPTLHFWYGFLTRTIPGNSLSSTVKRLVLDQVQCGLFPASSMQNSIIHSFDDVVGVCFICLCLHISLSLRLSSFQCSLHQRCCWRDIRRKLQAKYKTNGFQQF